MKSYPLRYQKGVSLIEALIAFAVMAFGMLAVVGMQATLRVNGDLSRQQTEAVRIAQDYIEEAKAFATIPTTANQMAYDDIATKPPFDVSGINATYVVTQRVTDEPAVEGTFAAARKSLSVEVSWTDRNSQVQRVTLSTVIAGLAPALEGSLLMGTNGSPIVLPRARNRFIPPTSKNLGDGTSAFIPPGQSPTETTRAVWRFDNTTGVITICTTTAQLTSEVSTIDTSTCQQYKALLISGYLHFDASSPPTSSSIASPTGTVPDLGLRIEAPEAPHTPSCFQDSTDPTAVAYYCTVPITAALPSWTGQVNFGSTEVATATSVAPGVETLFKVCRYPGVAATYTTQKQAVTNANFIFIRAGNASAIYNCPAPLTQHQP